jgi:uncharacterized protein YigE (DUF2233 family)
MTRRHPVCRFAIAAALVVFLAIGWARPAPAQWTLESSEVLPAPAEGVEHHAQTVIRPAAGGTVSGRATLHFVSFNARNCTFRVFDQGTLGRSRLAEVMESNHCLAGTNGGYFQPDFEPVGLLMADRHLVHRPAHARLLSGALVVTGNHIHLIRSSEPLPGKNAREAVQSGPFLVENGKTLPGLNNVRSARRTSVMMAGPDEWALVSSSAVTLEELGAILANPALLPAGLRAERALNLDGGSSTALWVRQPGADPYSVPEFGIVRDFVGIVERR